jgi:hypothetical protein
MTINNGSLDLTGGDITADDEVPPADWLIFFDFDEDSGTTKDESYNVNFTGPGSITVDKSGIIVPIQLDTGEWTNLEPVEYEDLWEAGILQADGMGVDSGRSFDEFFTVEGELGSDDYKLIRPDIVVPDPWPGDADGDGHTDAADLNILGLNWQKTVTGGIADADFNEDGFVDASDLNEIGSNWQTWDPDAPMAASVPEPSSVTLLLTAFLACCGILRKRRG